MDKNRIWLKLGGKVSKKNRIYRKFVAQIRENVRRVIQNEGIHVIRSKSSAIFVLQ